MHPNRAKVSLENKNGATALEVAKNWGDDFIYAIVYAKVASLPPPVEKKGESTRIITDRYMELGMTNAHM